MEVFNIKNNKVEVVELNSDMDYLMFLINQKVKSN